MIISFVGRKSIGFPPETVVGMSILRNRCYCYVFIEARDLFFLAFRLENERRGRGLLCSPLVNFNIAVDKHWSMRRT